MSSDTGTDTRQDSRLEVDDPNHCKWCGADISDITRFVEIDLCASCAGNKTELKAKALKQAKRTHGEDVHPENLDDPPESWELSDELWYAWSAEVQAQYISMAREEMAEWYVTIKAWQRDQEPGEYDFEQYTVRALDREEAEEKGIEKAKNHFTRGIIDTFDTDGYEVVEVSGPHA